MASHSRPTLNIFDMIKHHLRILQQNINHKTNIIQQKKKINTQKKSKNTNTNKQTKNIKFNKT
jgi:hypothetical protein